MDARELKRRIKAGEQVVGTWNHLPHYQVVEILGAAGLDFVVFDLEHGPHSFGDLPALYGAAEAHGMVPITRVPSLGNSNILRCLDSGTKGVMVPHVAGAAEARACLDAMKYGDSSGSRGVATLTRCSRFNMSNERAHLESQNDLITSILMIEDKLALAELDEICTLPGLDVVFVGIYDLSQSVGMRGGLDHPEFQELFANTVSRIQRHGIAVGCYAATPAAALKLRAMGITFITLCVDGAMLRRSYETALAEFAALSTVKEG